MSEEYNALMNQKTWSLVPCREVSMSGWANGFIGTSSIPMVLLLGIKLDGLFEDSLNNMV
jgi:hypothetical protein